MNDNPRLVCIRRCQGVDLAYIYKSKLEAAGIPALLQYESAGLVYGITVDGLGEVRILVPEADAEEARELLTELPDEAWEELPDGEDWADDQG
jgi:hypothetical protein